MNNERKYSKKGMRKFSLVKFTNHDWNVKIGLTRLEGLGFIKHHQIPYQYAETEDDFIKLIRMKQHNNYDQEFIKDLIDRRLKSEREYWLKLFSVKEEKLKQKMVELYKEAYPEDLPQLKFDFKQQFQA